MTANLTSASYFGVMKKYGWFLLLGIGLLPQAQAQELRRLAFGSCADYVGEDGDRIFSTVAQQSRPDLFLWLGDNLYYTQVDYAHPAGMKRAVDRRFGHPQIKSFLKSIPQRAIWDDHDYGPNDSDSSFIYRKQSQEIFSRFWKDTPIDLKKNGDLRWSERRGSILIIGLDDRSHRGPLGTQILGEGQLNWLESELKQNADAQWVFLALGSQILNESPVFENYIRFPQERQRLLSLLDRAPQSHLILLTGDRHHSETNRLTLPSGKQLIEYTSSSLSSKLFAPTPKEIEENGTLDRSSVVTAYNYGMIEFLDNGHLRVQYLGKDGKVLWEETLGH